MTSNYRFGMLLERSDPDDHFFQNSNPQMLFLGRLKCCVTQCELSVFPFCDIKTLAQGGKQRHIHMAPYPGFWYFKLLSRGKAFLVYRLFLLALHHLGYHLELFLQLSICRALALQPIYLLLQRSPRSAQIKDLRQLASLSLRHAVELPPEVAVEIVNEREQKVAVELGDGRLAEGLSPLLDYVLDEAADLLSAIAQMATGCEWTQQQAVQAELAGAQVHAKAEAGGRSFLGGMAGA